MPAYTASCEELVLARKEGLHVVLLRDVRSSLISYRPGMKLSKPAEQFFRNPEALSLDERELVPQCMPAFDMMKRH